MFDLECDAIGLHLARGCSFLAGTPPVLCRVAAKAAASSTLVPLGAVLRGEDLRATPFKTGRLLYAYTQDRTNSRAKKIAKLDESRDEV